MEHPQVIFWDSEHVQGEPQPFKITNGVYNRFIQRRFADVYFHNNHVLCELCKAENCEHVQYALKIPKVQKLLRKKGWKIQEGKIIQRPYWQKSNPLKNGMETQIRQK